MYIPGSLRQKNKLPEKSGKFILEKRVEFSLLHEAHHRFTIFQPENDLEIGTT